MRRYFTLLLFIGLAWGHNGKHPFLTPYISPGIQFGLNQNKTLFMSCQLTLGSSFKITNEKHFDGRNTPPLELVIGQRIHSASPFPDFDGNTVDLDREMAKMAENQLMYNASIRMLTHQFRMLKTAITEGR